MFGLNSRSMKLIVAGVLCWVAALFYFIYIKNYDAPGILILVAFFGYFSSQRKWGGSDNASNPFKVQDGGSPIRELAQGLGCVVIGAAIAAAAGFTIPSVDLAVAIALTAVVAGCVVFVLFLLRAFSAWGSGRGRLE